MLGLAMRAPKMFTSLHSTSSKQIQTTSGPSNLNLKIQTCPITIDDNTSRGPGSFITGQVLLNTTRRPLECRGLQFSLDLVTKYKHPAVDHCRACRVQRRTVHQWESRTQPTQLEDGLYSVPFFEFLPNDLPQSLRSSIARLEYRVRATAIVGGLNGSEVDLESVTAEEGILVRRASSEIRLPSYCSRSFPKSGIQLCTFLDSLDAQGTSYVSINIIGLVQESIKSSMAHAWKITRAEWILEQTIEISAPSCGRHVRSTEGSLDDIAPRLQTCRLTGGTLYDGWKRTGTDRDEATLDFSIDLSDKKKLRSPLVCSYDTPESHPVKVSHALTVELSLLLTQLLTDGADGASTVGVGPIVKAVFPVQIIDHLDEVEPYECEQPPLY
jgi:hypothetical protein